MRALVYHGPGQKGWEDAPKPTIHDDTDAIVRVDTTTICGTDLHILKGGVPAVTDGRILGHEAVGTVEEVGAGVKTMREEPRRTWYPSRPRVIPTSSKAATRTVPPMTALVDPWMSCGKRIRSSRAGVKLACSKWPGERYRSLL